MFQAELETYGYVLRNTEQSIGAAVGTATHRVVELALELKAEGSPYLDLVADEAAESIEKSIEKGVIWDDTTRKKDDAIKQAVRQGLLVLAHMPEMKSIVIEGELKADMGDYFILSGHVDIRGSEDGEEWDIWDVKTGVIRRANQGQYGAYSILARSNGHNVRSLGEIYAKRVGVNVPQPEPVIVQYPKEIAEAVAYHTSRRIKGDIITFRESGGDPWVWIPNPNSMMCSDKYCPAWGTNFCNCHK